MGEALTSTNQNATTETLNTSIVYGTDTSDSKFNEYGYPKTVNLPSGGWEVYGYMDATDPAYLNWAV